MDDRLVLSEDEVFEVAAFLVTAACLLPDEPIDSGPVRLLTAAQRLCAFAALRRGESAMFLMELAREIPRHLSSRNSDPDGFRVFLQETSRAIAREVARRVGREV
jgi:hypothetical protein